MLAVSDTSPVSNLAIIGQLDLLQVQFGNLWIPDAVGVELRHIGHRPTRQRIEEAQRAGWLKTKHVNESALVALLSRELHRGEAEAIAMAIEMNADFLLIDERDGRIAARQAGLTLTGVLGVLLRAKTAAQITTVKPYIQALRTQARFFISERLETEVLRSAGESLVS